MTKELVRTDNLTPEHLSSIAQEILDLAVAKRMEEEDDDLFAIIFPPEAGEIEAEYAWILDLFAGFTTPEPEAMDDLKFMLHNAENRLSEDDSARMNPTDLEIGDWGGGAFEAFEENYVSTWTDKRSIHLTLLRALAGSIEAYRELWYRVRQNIYSTGHATRRLLKEYEPSDAGLFGGGPIESISLALTVMGTVVTAPITGPISIAWTITLLSTSVAVANHYNSVAGNSVDTILISMKTRIDDIRSNGIDSEENIILDGLKDTLSGIDQHYVDVIPPAASLATMDPDHTGTDLIPPGRASGS